MSLELSGTLLCKKGYLITFTGQHCFLMIIVTMQRSLKSYQIPWELNLWRTVCNQKWGQLLAAQKPLKRPGLWPATGGVGRVDACLKSTTPIDNRGQELLWTEGGENSTVSSAACRSKAIKEARFVASNWGVGRVDPCPKSTSPTDNRGQELL